MTWSETRRRNDVVREVRAMAEVRRDGVLPWSEDYSDAFTGPDDLLRELAYRWRNQVEAQIDTNLAEPELEERHRELATRHAAVLRILEASSRQHALAA